jgi:vitamin B12 transporter
MPFPFPQRPLAIALCLFPLAATAQSAPSPSSVPTLGDIVVTASRSPEPLSDAVGDVTVIGPEQLQAAQGESLAQILGQAPGVQFTTTGGPQTATGISLRGANTNQTLVLVDGLRVNDSTSGQAAFPAIDPAMIDHIEILRGAASSLYGSDAIGGVINIITKRGRQDRPLSAWANVGYGTYGTAKSSLGLSGASGGWDYSLASGAATSRGFDATRAHYSNGAVNTNHDPDTDGYRGHSLSGTLGYAWAEGHHIGLTAYDGLTRGDYDVGTSTPDAYAFYRQQAYSLTSSDRVTDGWHSDLRFGFTKNGYDDRAYQTLLNSIDRTYSWTNTFTLPHGQSLALLLERQEERIQSSDTDYTRDARNDNAAALIYKGRFGPVHTQASVRNDRYTGYGSETTGSLGADFDLGDRWQVGVAANTGFRAPTFNDLYWPFQDFGGGHTYSGNPDLKPEKSRNVEAHLQYRTDQTLIRLTAFQNKIHDLISINSSPASSLINIDSATLRGITLTGQQAFGDTTLRASADFLDPRNDNPSDGESSQLPRRARQVFHFGVEQRIEAWKIGAEYQYTGNRIDSYTQARLGGYSLVNLTASYDFTKSLGMQIRWNNVFDKDYVLADGYNTPGSNVFVNLSWKM